MINQTSQNLPAPKFEIISDYLFYWAKETPDAKAIIFIGRRLEVELTYKELAMMVTRMAIFMARNGIRPGARLGVFVNRDIRMLVTMLAASTLGAVCLPFIHPSANGKSVLEKYQKLYNFDIIFHSGLFNSFVEEFRNNCNQLGLHTVSFENNDIKAFFDKKVSRGEEIGTLPSCDVHGDIPFYINHTGGTTGHPKIVEATHLELILNAQACINYFKTTSETIFFCTFFFHQHELFLRSLMVGGVSVLLPHQAGSSLSATCLRTRANHLMLNPVYASMFANESQADLKKLRGILSVIEIGGGIVSEDTCNKLLNLSGANVIPVYGATELSGAALACPSRSNSWSGLEVIPGYHFEIRNKKQRHGSHKNGELFIKGPAVASSYVFSPSSDKTRLNNSTFATGDFAVMEGSNVKIMGRLSNCVKCVLGNQSLELLELEVMRYLPAGASVQMLNIEAGPDSISKTIGHNFIAVVMLPPSIPDGSKVIQKSFSRAKLRAVLGLPAFFLIAKPGNDDISIAHGKIQRHVARKRFPFRLADWKQEDRSRLIRVSPTIPQWVRLGILLFKEGKTMSRPVTTFLKVTLRMVRTSLVKE
jgi:acyl-CoA synthetase (AMP-forming)/AMP-acid ligase II